MNKNIVLQFTTFVFSIGRIFIALFFAALLILGIADFINDDFGSDTVLQTGKLMFDSSSDISMGLSNYAASKPFKFAFVMIQNMASLIFLFVIFGSLLKVSRSIKNLRTFTVGNVKAFRNISLFTFLIFSVQLITITPEKFSFSLSLSPLVAAAFAYILAEVFKEGQQLLEDNELTV